MNLGGVVDSFAMSGTLSVTRRAAGTVSNGIYAAGSTTPLSLVATVHPADGRTVKLLPEGHRSREAIVIFTKDALRGVQDPAGAPADLVSYSGVTYEVQVVENWSGPAAYYRSIATKVPIT